MSSNLHIPWWLETSWTTHCTDGMKKLKLNLQWGSYSSSKRARVRVQTKIAQLAKKKDDKLKEENQQRHRYFCNVKIDLAQGEAKTSPWHPLHISVYSVFVVVVVVFSFFFTSLSINPTNKLNRLKRKVHEWVEGLRVVHVCLKDKEE